MTSSAILPKFLVMRFAPGAAGNFVSSLLQCSREVAHWDPFQQNQKPNNDWIEYFRRVFSVNLSEWLNNEPIVKLNWGTREIFSQKYDRGNTLTCQEFLHLEEKKCNQYYHEQKIKGRLLPIFWHKNIMPVYFENSVSVTIKLDAASLRWYDHCKYFKHHKVIAVHPDRSVTVQLLENRPAVVLEQFKDQVEYEKTYPSFKHFVKDRIIDNPWRHQFSGTDTITPWHIPNVDILLGDIINVDRIWPAYQNICLSLGIKDMLTQPQVLGLHNFWRQLHDF